MGGAGPETQRLLSGAPGERQHSGHWVPRGLHPPHGSTCRGKDLQAAWARRKRQVTSGCMRPALWLRFVEDETKAMTSPDGVGCKRRTALVL